MTESTRIRSGQQESLLDLVFAKDENFITNIDMAAPLGKSDHCTMLIGINIGAGDTGGLTTHSILRLNKGDYDGMRNFLINVDWDRMLSNKLIDEMWSDFRTTMETAIEHFIPKREAQQQSDPMWMTPEVRTVVDNKKKAWKRYLFCKTQERYSQYKILENNCREIIKSAQKSLESKVAIEAKENPKSFWKFVNSKAKPKLPVGKILDNNGNLTENNKETARCLNEYFSSVFTEDKVTVTSEYLKAVSEAKVKFTDMPEINITQEKIMDKLKLLKPDRAAGPDKMIPRILIEVKAEIVSPLHKIFNVSLHEGRLPDDWKDADVIPIFKKGSKKEASNYRPISLTSVVGKMLEAIIRDALMAHFLTNNLISEAQYGFIPGRSCCLQLLNMLDTWTQQLDENLNIDVIYTDLQKAFDTVSHCKLLYKLKNFKIDNKVYNWIKNFLADRRQRVRVQNDTSNWIQVKSGVPQGSVLGPILFLVYINDLVTKVQYGKIELFADDSKISNPIINEQDVGKLQSDIDSVVNWSEEWGLKFNPKKCKVLHLGPKNFQAKYYMKDEQQKIELESVLSEKDLGVYIDHNLNFQVHIGEIISKANKILGLIRRSFKYLNQDMFLTLYKTLVRPVLEYSSPVWSPQKKKDIKMVECVQRRATKLLGHIRDLPYPDRLKVLNLTTLEYRRERADLIQVFKIIKGIDRIDVNTFFTMTTDSRTRGHKFKIQKLRSRLNIRKYFFTNRIVDSWNSLPECVIEVETVDAFKNRLENFYDNNPKKYVPTFMQF